MSWYPCINEDDGGGGLEIVTWADGTDEQIVAMLEAHYAGDIDVTEYWSVGDERTVSLSAMSATGVGESHVAQDVVLVLSQVGGKTLSDGSITCAFQVDQKQLLKESGYMNNTGTNVGGWKSSARRTWCNSVYYNAIPSTLRQIFKQFINQSGLGNGSSSGVEDTTDYFALRAEVEVSNTEYQASPGEGSQVDWYKTSANQYKQLNGYANSWWYRSPKASYSNSFVYFNSDKGYAQNSNAASSCCLAPFGVI